MEAFDAGKNSNILPCCKLWTQDIHGKSANLWNTKFEEKKCSKQLKTQFCALWVANCESAIESTYP